MLICRAAPAVAVDVKAAGAAPAAPAAPAGTIMEALGFGPLLPAIDRLRPQGWVAGALLVQPVAGNGASALNDPSRPILEEFHATALVGRSYQRGQRVCLLKVYRFESPLGAYGAYTSLRRGATTVVVRGDASSEDDQSLSFWQGNYFVSLSTTAEDDDEAKDMMRSLANEVASAIDGHADRPYILGWLPRPDRVSGSEKLIMGPVACRRASPVPYQLALSLDTARAAASADYQFQRPSPDRLKLLLIDYGDRQKASRIYRHYTASLDEAHDAAGTGTSALYKLAGTYMLCQLRGNQIAIISGARKRRSPGYLSRQLDFSLPAQASPEVGSATPAVPETVTRPPGADAAAPLSTAGPAAPAGSQGR